MAFPHPVFPRSFRVCYVLLGVDSHFGSRAILAQVHERLKLVFASFLVASLGRAPRHGRMVALGRPDLLAWLIGGLLGLTFASSLPPSCRQSVAHALLTCGGGAPVRRSAPRAQPHPAADMVGSHMASMRLSTAGSGADGGRGDGSRGSRPSRTASRWQ